MLSNMAIFTAQELLQRHGLKPDDVKSVGMPQAETQGAGALQTAKDLGIGIVKGAGATVKGLADLGRPIQAALDPTKTLADYNADPSGKISESSITASNNTQRVGQGIEFVAEVVLPAGLVGKGAKYGKAVVEEGLAKLKGLPKPTLPKVLESESIMQRVARIPKQEQVKFETMAKESVGSYLNKRQIYGNTEEISQQLYKRFTTSRQVADNALEALPGNFRSPQIKTALTELEGKVARTSSPGAPDADLSRVTELVTKEKQTGLTMSEINEVKRIFERRVRLDYLKTRVPEDVTRANNIDDAIRSWQFAQAEKLGLQNLPEINKETQLARQLLDAIGKQNAGTAGNNSVTLTDWILLSGGDPTAIGAFLAKKIFSAKGIQSEIAKKLYTGETKGVPIRITGSDSVQSLPIK